MLQRLIQSQEVLSVGAAGAVSKEEGPFPRVARGQKERGEPLKSGLDVTSGMLRMRAHAIYSVEMKKLL